MDDMVDSAKDVAQEVEKKALEAEKKIEQKLTYLWHEIAPWQQDNQYITSGYRPPSDEPAPASPLTGSRDPGHPPPAAVG